VQTGLVWVDFDNFFNQNTSDMKTIVEAAGFTFASRSSVETLLGDLSDLPTSWNSYASIMGKAPNRDIIWGSYDDGNNGPNDTFVGVVYANSFDTQWIFSDNYADISNIPNQDSTGADLNIFAYKAQASSTAVPEPFTIVGTLVGGSAALRMRKKLSDANKA
jgi:hypothetical protein